MEDVEIILRPVECNNWIGIVRVGNKEVFRSDYKATYAGAATRCITYCKKNGLIKSHD